MSNTMEWTTFRRQSPNLEIITQQSANRAYPNVTKKVWFGDQSNVTFLLQVVAEYAKMNQGQKTWDIIIDDGGHYKKLMEASFATLWPFVAPGGYYIIEDLHMAADCNYNRNFHFFSLR